MSRITILVCTSCRTPGQPLEPRDDRAGGVLHRALSGLDAADVDVVPVECLSVCKRPVTVGLVGADRWTYIYGEFLPGQEAEILAAARQYAATPDGIIPWRERPAALKTGVVARIPPLPHTPAPTSRDLP